MLDNIKETAEAGIAVIYITHPLHLFERIVDNGVILHRGQSVGDFNIGDINLKQYANLIMLGRF